MRMKRLQMLNPKSKPLFKHRVFILFFGVIASLVLLELSLRLSGYIYHIIRTPHKSIRDSNSIQNRGSFTIICLGDSFTYGAGASFKYSYPSQLEKMVNEVRKEKKINVQNLGSPGGNAYRILKIFIENINQYNPHVAIVMIGMNNDWNLEGMPNLLKNTKLDIYDLRIYKLWRILTMSLHNKMAKEPQDKPEAPQVQIPVLEWQAYKKKVESFREVGRSDLALEEINSMLKKYPGARQIEAESVLYLREMGNYAVAETLAKKVLTTSPPDPQANAYMHLELVYIYRAKKEWQLARQELDYVIEDLMFIQSVFPELKAICNEESGLDFNKEIVLLRERAHTIHGKKGTQILDTLLYIEKNKEAKSKILESDLLKLIHTAKQNSIQLILMTYPFSVSTNEVIRKVAKKYNTRLIDNELIFDKRPHKEELFNLDSHCNAKGYALIATNIYSTLLTMGVLPRERIGQ